MKIAIPSFDQRVASDFSTAPELRVVVSHKGSVCCSWKMKVLNLSAMDKARKIVALGIDRLICGGIDEPTRTWLERRGIQVITDVTGETERVLKGLLEATSQDPGVKGGAAAKGRPD